MENIGLIWSFSTFWHLTFSLNFRGLHLHWVWNTHIKYKHRKLCLEYVRKLRVFLFVCFFRFRTQFVTLVNFWSWNLTPMTICWFIFPPSLNFVHFLLFPLMPTTFQSLLRYLLLKMFLIYEVLCYRYINVSYTWTQCMTSERKIKFF